MNREADKDTAASVETTSVDEHQTQVQIALKNKPEDSNMKLITPKEVIVSKTPTVELKTEENKRNYVYAKGNVKLAT